MEILASAGNVLVMVQLATCADVISPDIYGTVSRGNRYFDNRLRAFYWTDACTEDKRKALIEATQIIDSLNYVGAKTDPTQLHQFPRSAPGSTCPVVEAVVDTAVPINIEIAAYEIAIQLLSGIDPDIEIENLAAHSQGFSTARTTYERAYALEHIVAGVPSARAWKLLKPFLCDPGLVKISRVN